MSLVRRYHAWRLRRAMARLTSATDRLAAAMDANTAAILRRLP